MKQIQVIEVQPQGYCGGVLKAISIAKETRAKYPLETITLLGNLVHNKYVKQALELENIKTIENKNKTRLELLDEIDQGIVIFTAHGVAPNVKEKALKKGLKIVDASCPFVVQTQKIIQQKIQDGYEILYIGKYKHPEAESIYTMDEHVHLIQDQTIPKLDTEKVFVTNQTTMSIYDIQELFRAIKQAYPKAQFHDEICNATRVRQQAVLDLQGQGIDALIVVGDPTSNNTQKLLETGQQAQIPIGIKIQDINELDPNDLKDAKKVAVTSGASTPTFLTKQIIRAIENQDYSHHDIPIKQIL